MIPSLAWQAEAVDALDSLQEGDFLHLDSPTGTPIVTILNKPLEKPESANFNSPALGAGAFYCTWSPPAA